MQQYRPGKHLTANSLRGNSRDLTKVGMSHTAMGPWMSSRPPGAGLILHQEGRASRSEEAQGHQLVVFQPTPVFWEMPGTQVRLRAWRRAQ